MVIKFLSLNPTFSGIWSATVNTTCLFHLIRVLILLFLEYGLRQFQKQKLQQSKKVLILLFLEYGLRPGAVEDMDSETVS